VYAGTEHQAILGVAKMLGSRDAILDTERHSVRSTSRGLGNPAQAMATMRTWVMLLTGVPVYACDSRAPNAGPRGMTRAVVKIWRGKWA